MNEEILKRFRLTNDKEALQLFFEHLNLLFESLNLSSDSEKLSLNIRNDNRKRISVNINSRLVFGLATVHGIVELIFMIYEDDLNQIINYRKPEEEMYFAVPVENKKTL